MSFFYVVGLAFVVLITGLIGSGNNGAAYVAVSIFFPACIALYFAPTIVAHTRQHPNKTSISVLNFILGWSVLGWMVALVWSYSQFEKVATIHSNKEEARRKAEDEPLRAANTPLEPPKPETKQCPFCVEEVKYAAVICKHCRSELPAVPIESPPNEQVHKTLT